MILRTQQRVVRRAERRLAKKIRKDLLVLGYGIEKLVSSQDTERAFDNELQGYIDLWGLKFKQWISKDLINLYMLGSRYINKAVEGNLNLANINLLAVKRVNSLKSLEGTNIQGSINYTTFNRVKEIIADGVFDGDSYTTIGESIRKQFDAGIFSKARSELVAINSVGNAYEQGRRESMQDLINQGYTVQKVWDTVGDNKVTPQCRNNESQGRITFKENRPSGDSEAPRASNPRCRCSCNYEIL